MVLAEPDDLEFREHFSEGNPGNGMGLSGMILLHHCEVRGNFDDVLP